MQTKTLKYILQNWPIRLIFPDRLLKMVRDKLQINQELLSIAALTELKSRRQLFAITKFQFLLMKGELLGNRQNKYHTVDQTCVYTILLNGYSKP